MAPLLFSEDALHPQGTTAHMDFEYFLTEQLLLKELDRHLFCFVFKEQGHV